MKNKIVLIGVYIIVWTLIGHFMPTIYFFATWLSIPSIVVLIEKIDRPKTDKLDYSWLLFSFLLVFIIDILFRKLGGGTFDDAARGLCLLSFYATITTLVLTWIFYIVDDVVQRAKTDSQWTFLLLGNILLLLVVSGVSILLYQNFVFYRT